jgi:hypothetical protein
MLFAGIDHPEKFRLVTRSHVIAWRDDLTQRIGHTEVNGVFSRIGIVPAQPDSLA